MKEEAARKQRSNARRSGTGRSQQATSGDGMGRETGRQFTQKRFCSFALCTHAAVMVQSGESVREWICECEREMSVRVRACNRVSVRNGARVARVLQPFSSSASAPSAVGRGLVLSAACDSTHSTRVACCTAEREREETRRKTAESGVTCMTAAATALKSVTHAKAGTSEVAARDTERKGQSGRQEGDQEHEKEGWV